MRPFDLPLGYKYATAYAGIRKQEKDDLALIISGVPAAAAAVFTTNRVQAAPVKLARANMRASKGVCGAILVNAGNANCATKTGDKVAANTTRALAKLLKLQPNQVLPASTGVIGVEMDENLILSKIPLLVERLNDTGLPDVARAQDDIGGAQHGLELAAGDAHHVADHQQRKRLRDCLDEVDLALLTHGVDDLGADLLH